MEERPIKEGRIMISRAIKDILPAPQILTELGAAEVGRYVLKCLYLSQGTGLLNRYNPIVQPGEEDESRCAEHL
jgi:hypothetical protein